MELVGDIRPDAHVQVLCDPFEGNGRFRSEPSGDMDFAHIAFGLADQVCFGPAQLVELSVLTIGVFASVCCCHVAMVPTALYVYWKSDSGVLLIMPQT